MTSLLAITSLALTGPRIHVKELSVSFARTQVQAQPLPIAVGSKFLISFFNASGKPIKLLAEQCSWGYESVTFEVVNPAGASYSITRKPKVWKKNYPIPVLVEPGAVFLRAIDFGDGTWAGLPAGVAGTRAGWKVRVKETIRAEKILIDKGFWIGESSSPWTVAGV
jgi:hypothetical protein